MKLLVMQRCMGVAGERKVYRDALGKDAYKTGSVSVERKGVTWRGIWKVLVVRVKVLIDDGNLAVWVEDSCVHMLVVGDRELCRDVSGRCDNNVDSEG